MTSAELENCCPLGSAFPVDLLTSLIQQYTSGKSAIIHLHLCLIVYFLNVGSISAWLFASQVRKTRQKNQSFKATLRSGCGLYPVLILAASSTIRQSKTILDARFAAP